MKLHDTLQKQVVLRCSSGCKAVLHLVVMVNHSGVFSLIPLQGVASLLRYGCGPGLKLGLAFWARRAETLELLIYLQQPTPWQEISVIFPNFFQATAVHSRGHSGCIVVARRIIDKEKALTIPSQSKLAAYIGYISDGKPTPRLHTALKNTWVSV